jgi:cysteine desulfurase
VRIYLDHAATTPLSDASRVAMEPWWADGVAANASSVHRAGQRARAAVESAREQLAAAIGAAPAELVFTSGATEADALAIVGTLEAAPPDAPLVVSAAEHAAVVQVAAREERRGRPVVRLAPGSEGAPAPDRLERVLGGLDRSAALVAVMHTNNETGVLADVPGLADVAHAHGAALLCDAVQAFGYAELDVRTMGADLVALSSHKIGGPQGVGALWIRGGHELVPQAVGGAQERGRRAGTQPVALVVGFGAAAEEAGRDVRDRAERTARLRDRLEARMLALPGVHRNGSGPRGPKHLNVRVEGVDGEALLIALDAAGVEASAGSACSAGSLEPSHVLTAMGLSRDQARASLRFSLAPSVSASQIDTAAERFAATLERLRSA